jgi:uncharacterized protein (DUF2147 family)
MKRRLTQCKPPIALLVGIFVALGVLQAHAQAPQGTPAAVRTAVNPAGRWLTASGNLEVDIAPCGQALCGTVVRVLANRSMSNPKVELAPTDSPPALGMKILTDFTPSGDGEWQGHIYNRENGKTYSCLMALAASDQLNMRPYIGLSLFGKTQIWRRVADPKGQK